MWHIKNCEHEEATHAYTVTVASELRTVSLLLVEDDVQPERHELFVSEGADPWKRETQLEYEYEVAWGHRLRSYLSSKALSPEVRADLEHIVDSLEHKPILH